MIINTGLLAFASWRDRNQHKAAGISCQMSADNPVPVLTSCEKVDQEIQRQVSKWEGYVLVLTLSFVSWEMLSKTFTFSCAVSQTDCRAESVVLGKLILRWWFRNAFLIGFSGFVITEAFLMTCKKCGKLKAPQLCTLDHVNEPFSYVWKIPGQNFNTLIAFSIWENNWEISLSPRQKNLWAASQRVSFTQDWVDWILHGNQFHLEALYTL